MKPKAPKKKDTKPSAKSGKVWSVKEYELDWHGDMPTYHIEFDIKAIQDIKFKFNFKD